MKLIVTGGLGFIGSNFVNMIGNTTDWEILIIDSYTYAADIENITLPKDRYDLSYSTIASQFCFETSKVEDFDADAVVNFAAETHVDNSIKNSDPFIQTNIVGAYNCLKYCEQKGIRLLQISTDEVYGSILEGSFNEDDPIVPSSPYSASKAAADLLIQSHIKTHGVNASIIRGSNNYGPHQNTEKLIPKTITNALAGETIPVYGNGLQVRNWIYVEDFCEAIKLVLLEGESIVYTAGGPDELTNIDVVSRILESTGNDISLVSYVDDRLAHDFRYSLSSTRLKQELGWSPQVSFDKGIDRTVEWYKNK
jgi:dTDP-glucose 4,6-dehydratase